MKSSELPACPRVPPGSSELEHRMTMDKDDLAKELLKTFHSQFAENQRVKEQSFLQIVGYLGAIIFGYAYVFENLKNERDVLSLVAIAASLLLALGAWVVVVISYNWRRDQLVNANIRRYCGLMGGANSIFPASYDPSTTLQSKNVISWMPNLLAIFYLMFPAFEVLLLASFLVRTRPVLCMSHIDWFVSSAVLVSLLCILATCFAPRYFMKLLIEKASTTPAAKPTVSTSEPPVT
jgi:lipid-A-disaccharide synthase-like uncharacterized protein